MTRALWQPAAYCSVDRSLETEQRAPHLISPLPCSLARCAWKTLIHLPFVGGKSVYYFYILPRIEIYYGQKHSLWSQEAYCQTPSSPPPPSGVVLGWLGEVVQLVPCAQAPRWVGEQGPKSRLPCICLTVQANFEGTRLDKGLFFLM